jgi:hypothetical protein
MQRIASFVVGLVVGGAALAAAVALGVLTLGPHGAQGLKVAAKQPLICRDAAAQCQNHVSVNCDSSPCTLSVDYDYTIVGTGKAPILLTWQLETSGYAFADNGIQFPAGTPFENCHKEGTGQRFRCLDKNPQFDVHKYTINVTGPNPVTALDPWVVND